MTQPPGHPGRSGYGDDPYRPPGAAAPGGSGYRPRHGYNDDHQGGSPDAHADPHSDPYRVLPEGDPYRRRSTPQPAPGPPTRGAPTQEGPSLPAYGPGEQPPEPRRGAAGVVVGILGMISVLLLVAVVGFVLLGRESGDGDGVAGASPTVDSEFADPARVVDHWLRAMFILKDPDEMLRFTCRRGANRAELEDAVDTVKQAEQDAKDADLTMTVSWSKPAEESREEKRAKVTSTITWIVGEKSRRSPASFELFFEAGWKVCASEMR